MESDTNNLYSFLWDALDTWFDMIPLFSVDGFGPCHACVTMFKSVLTIVYANGDSTLIIYFGWVHAQNDPWSVSYLNWDISQFKYETDHGSFWAWTQPKWDDVA